MKYLKNYNESLHSVRKDGIKLLMDKLLSSDIIEILESSYKKYQSSERYKINDDLSIDIYGDIYIKNINSIPIKLNNVYGCFMLGGLNDVITSLKNGPIFVDGSCDISSCGLESLEFCPKIVTGIFNFSKNNIKDLSYFPEEVGEFDGTGNWITNVYEKLNNGEYYGSTTFNPIHILLYQIKYDLSETTYNEKDIIDKLLEFEVIKDNNRLDLISLNSLYDFLDISFHEWTFKEMQGYIY